MKANYTKPLLAIDLFSLAQFGARDCCTSIPKENLNFNDPGKCVWDTGTGVTVFVEEANCDINGENMEVGCYNNPSEGNYVFRS